MNLTKTQQKLSAWLKHNFPETNSDQQLKGVMEELGELCHADLKAHQGIRGYTPEKAKDEIMDAVGDIIIYLINYCNTKDISFKDSLDMAYSTVMKRDWIKNPTNGKTPSIELLTCGLCGSSVKGRQWKNTMKGQSVCKYCYSRLKNTCRDTEHLRENYGDEGYHFDIRED